MTRPKLAVALALLVTAAVTFIGPRCAQAQAGVYAPVITNLKTKAKATWNRHTFPDQARCDAALGNLNDVLAALGNPDPEVKPPEPTGDVQLSDDTGQLMLMIIQNTGAVPRLSISCELQGDPA